MARRARGRDGRSSNNYSGVPFELTDRFEDLPKVNGGHSRECECHSVARARDSAWLGHTLISMTHKFDDLIFGHHN